MPAVRRTQRSQQRDGVHWLPLRLWQGQDTDGFHHAQSSASISLEAATSHTEFSPACQAKTQNPPGKVSRSASSDPCSAGNGPTAQSAARASMWPPPAGSSDRTSSQPTAGTDASSVGPRKKAPSRLVKPSLFVFSGGRNVSKSEFLSRTLRLEK